MNIFIAQVKYLREAFIARLNVGGASVLRFTVCTSSYFATEDW